MHLTEPQRALLGYISAGQKAIIQAEEELRTKVSLTFFSLAQQNNHNIFI